MLIYELLPVLEFELRINTGVSNDWTTYNVTYNFLAEHLDMACIGFFYSKGWETIGCTVFKGSINSIGPLCYTENAPLLFIRGMCGVGAAGKAELPIVISGNLHLLTLERALFTPTFSDIRKASSGVSKQGTCHAVQLSDIALVCVTWPLWKARALPLRWAHHTYSHFSRVCYTSEVLHACKTFVPESPENH